MKNKLLQQFIMLAQLTFYGIFLQCLFIGVLLASDLEAQGVQKVHDVYVTLDGSEFAIKKIFEKIEADSDFEFSYYLEGFDTRKKIQTTKGRVPVSEVLMQISEEAKVSFRQINNVINVRKSKKREAGLTIEIEAADVSISGKITDENGEGLPGASVVLKGTSMGTTSDLDGNYKLTVPETSVLTITYVGYVTKEITVGNQNVIDVQLELDAAQLEEVVVIGYGSQKKELLTGAVSSVKSEKISVAPLASTYNTLAGQLPGLKSRQVSGMPGSDAAELSIRGFGAALVIVDGMQRDFNSLDPSQIESISILKDGAASIYGARAGNGVILVTTKRGKNQKPTFNLNTSWTGQSVTRILRPASSGQIAEMEREAHIQSGGDPSTSPWTEEAIAAFYAGNDPAFLNTDWYGHTFRDWAPQQNHNLSVRGGSDKIRYYGYLGYAKQETMVKKNGGDYSRYNVQSNLDADITDNLELGIDLAMTFERNNFPVRGMNNGGAFWQDYYRTRPWFPATLPDPTRVPWGGIDVGSIATVSNIDLMGYNRRNNKTIVGNLNLTYDFEWLEGLQAKANVNYNSGDGYTKRFQKPITFWTYNTTTDEYTASAAFNQSTLSERIDRSSMLTQQYSLQYESKFSDVHRISALALYESIEQKSNYISASRNNLLTPAIDQMFIGSTTGMGNDGSASELGRKSWVGRVEYDYQRKYLIQGIFRADASAKFPTEKRWGYFPSISGGWIMSEENFMSSINFLDFLKVRASYGQSGNDGVGNFQYLSGYQTKGSVIFDEGQLPGIYITGLANPLLTWEKMTIYNVGVDFSLWKDEKLYGTIEAFYRDRNGIPATRVTSLPSTFGSSLPPENLNQLDDRGFELSLGTKNNLGDFTYDINGNITYARSKWVYYEEPEYEDEDQKRISQRTGQYTDRSVGYVSDGLFTSIEEIDALPYVYESLGGNTTLQPGDVKYLDLNGDGILNWKDQTEIGKSNTPNWMFAINGSFLYKGFSLITNFQGATGYSTQVNVTGYHNEVMYDLRWTEENNDPSALVPRLGGASSNGFFSDYRLQDVTYIRLKAASLGYSVPNDIVGKIGLDQVKIYLAGTNLFSLSSLDKFKVDPELENNSVRVYPQQRTISLGLNISF